MLCLFSNLRPTPTCSKSVGIFILFNLMEGDSNLKLFDFGKQIKYTVQQRVRNVTAPYQRHISKQISLFPFQNNSDPCSVLLYPYISFLKGPTTSSRHSTASHACHFFLFFYFCESLTLPSSSLKAKLARVSLSFLHVSTARMATEHRKKSKLSHTLRCSSSVLQKEHRASLGP